MFWCSDEVFSVCLTWVCNTIVLAVQCAVSPGPCRRVAATRCEPDSGDKRWHLTANTDLTSAIKIRVITYHVKHEPGDKDVWGSRNSYLKLCCGGWYKAYKAGYYIPGSHLTCPDQCAVLWLAWLWESVQLSPVPGLLDSSLIKMSGIGDPFRAL